MLDLSVPIEQVNYLASHKSMAMTKRYDHANEERYGAAIEALDAAGKTSSAEALAASTQAGSRHRDHGKAHLSAEDPPASGSTPSEYCRRPAPPRPLFSPRGV